MLNECFTVPTNAIKGQGKDWSKIDHNAAKQITFDCTLTLTSWMNWDSFNANTKLRISLQLTGNSVRLLERNGQK